MSHLNTLKQAKEAIEWALDFIPPESDTDCKCPLCEAHDVLEAAMGEAQKQEPAAYYDAQEHTFRWAKPTSFGYVPVTVKIDPIPLYAAPLNLSDKSVQKRLAAQWGYVPKDQT